MLGTLQTAPQLARAGSAAVRHKEQAPCLQTFARSLTRNDPGSGRMSLQALRIPGRVRQRASWDPQYAVRRPSTRLCLIGFLEPWLADNEKGPKE
jgi:hypothetical protein